MSIITVAVLAVFAYVVVLAVAIVAGVLGEVVCMGCRCVCRRLRRR